MRNSFVFYDSYFLAISELDEVTQCRVFNAVCKYALYGEEPDISGTEMAIFRLIKPTIDANEKKYLNGKKGGRPKSAPDIKKPVVSDSVESQKPQVSENHENQKPNVNDNVNENVNANVNVNENAGGSTAAVTAAHTKKYGEFSNVILTDEQYQALKSIYGMNKLSDYINRIDQWVQLSGKRYGDYALAVKKWIDKDSADTADSGEHSYSLDEFKQFVNCFDK